MHGYHLLCFFFSGATTTITEASQRPSFLSEDVLKSLILDVSIIFKVYVHLRAVIVQPLF